MHDVVGEHQPGVTDIWERFEKVRHNMPDNAGRGGIGTPDQVRKHIQGYADVGLDQLVFIQQSGKNRHEHICEALEMFGRRLLPDFKAAEEGREARKAEELAPYIAAALARKPRMAMPA